MGKKKNVENTSYKIKFTDSIRFISSSLSHHVDNLSEIYSKRCSDKNRKSECKFEWVENNKLFYDLKKSIKEQLKLMNELTKKFSNRYEFCNGDINKSILMLRKGVYLHDYMDSWERFNQISLPDKKAFYRELILEDISYEDYIHVQKVFEEFNIKYLGEYHDLYLKTDVLLLADVFENFREMCL